MRRLLFLVVLLMSMLVGRAETWTPVGQVKWTEGALTGISKNYYRTWNVNVERSNSRPGVYRMQPYSKHPLVGIANIDKMDDVYVILHAENPNRVYMEYYKFHHNSNGYYYHIFQRCPENGADCKYYGKISEKNTIEFPIGSFIVEGRVLGGNIAYPSDGSTSLNIHKIVFPDGFENPLPEASGVYMGIIAFNDEVNCKQISLLDETTKEDFTSFVDNLQMGNATLLYYAVDKSLSNMKSEVYPANLSNAVLITFTDGLDQGSLAMKPEYRTSRGYASYLSDLIGKTSIQGHKLDAYAIGLKSDDVYDDELFMYNLQSLASNEKNIMPVNDISELQQKLTELFENLNQQTTQRVVTIKVPMMSHGDIYRFTLDNSRNSATNSDIWFEGTFNIDNMSLEDVIYKGFTSASGQIIEAKRDGIKLIFTLTDCRNLEGGILDVDQNGIDQWQYISSRGVWNHNVENAKADDIDIQNIKSSVAIMFALDCSTSLGDLFPLVKSTANSFIDRLAGGNGETGIEDVLIGTNDLININDPDVEIYNLQGVKVNNPSSGIYICRKGNIVKKIVIR